MSNTITPRRCPFCRSVNIRVVLREPYPFDHRTGYVRCMACNARGPLYRFGKNEPTNEYAVIKEWNRAKEDPCEGLPLFQEGSKQ